MEKQLGRLLLVSNVHPLLAYCCCKACISVYICCRLVSALPEDGIIAFTAALAGGQSQVIWFSSAHTTPSYASAAAKPVALCICAEDECTCLEGRLLYQFPVQCLTKGHE